MEEITKETMAPQHKATGKRRALLAAGISLSVMAAAYLGLCIYASHSDAFFPNTIIDGVDVSGLTPAQAAQTLRDAIPEKTLDFYLPLADEAGDGVSAPEGETLYETSPAATVTYRDLGVTEALDHDAAVQQLFDRTQGQEGFLASGWSYLSRLFGEYALSLPLEPEAYTFRTETAQLAETFSREPQDTSYALAEDSLQVTLAQNGLSVSHTALERAVEEALSAYCQSEVYVPAAVLPAQTMTAQVLFDAVSGEAKNAGYDAATDSITPEQPGVTFDVETAQAAMDAAGPGATVSIPAQIESPAVTAEELSAVLFRDVLGECRTHVSGTAARINNVRLSAAACDGVVLNSGDVFSYNETTGQRTAAKGYQAAPAYVQGQTVDEIGGGVCQTSSTLYYACLRADLAITERYAHRYVPAYIDWGMDATVSWGGPDYKFTNDTDYPIKIDTSYSNGYLTVRILGTNVDGTYVRMTNEVLSKTPWETVYEDDPTLPAGTEQVQTSPYTGYRVRSYRNVYSADGALLSSTYEATSDYKSRDRVIVRGPALPEVPASGTAELPAEETGTAPEQPPETAAPSEGTVDPAADGETGQTPEPPSSQTSEPPPSQSDQAGTSVPSTER